MYGRCCFCVKHSETHSCGLSSRQTGAGCAQTGERYAPLQLRAHGTHIARCAATPPVTTLPVLAEWGGGGGTRGRAVDGLCCGAGRLQWPAALQEMPAVVTRDQEAPGGCEADGLMTTPLYNTNGACQWAVLRWGCVMVDHATLLAAASAMELESSIQTCPRRLAVQPPGQPLCQDRCCSVQVRGIWPVRHESGLLDGVLYARLTVTLAEIGLVHKACCDYRHVMMQQLCRPPLQLTCF